MRPNFLIHWTGKDIAVDALTTAHRSAYVDRLADILTHGLWMTQPVERIEGKAGSWIEYTTPLTCFTEIRLSQARLHSHQYGLLGIGVTRQFVLDRFGGPVHYVRNHASECIIGNVQAIRAALNDLGRQDLLDSFAVNTCYIKKMSEINQDDFTYLNEQEWRIVHTHAQTTAGRLVQTGGRRPEYRIPVQLGDIRIIVFPDEQTRAVARTDTRLYAWFQAPAPSGAILLTVQECEHF